MDDLELKLDEDNELTFKVVVEGAEELPSKIRFVIPGENGLTYGFDGQVADDGIKVTIPPMGKHFKENHEYKGKLELVVENRFFEIFDASLKFKNSIKVVSEAIVVKKNEKPKIVVKSAASPTVSTSSTKPKIKLETASLKQITSNLIKK